MARQRLIHGQLATQTSTLFLKKREVMAFTRLLFLAYPHLQTNEEKWYGSNGDLPGDMMGLAPC
jgi:hypothetical protein